MVPILNQNGQVPALRRNPVIARVVAMEAGQPQWNQAAIRLPKATSRSARVRGSLDFAAPHVVGARFSNVEIQWNLAGELELQPRIAAAADFQASLPVDEALEQAIPRDHHST